MDRGIDAGAYESERKRVKGAGESAVVGHGLHVSACGEEAVDSAGTRE